MAKDLKISEMQKTSSPREDAIIPIVEQGMNKSTTVGDIRKPLKDSLNNKQDKLISGTNIKTINGQTVLGEGNITIQNTAGSTDYTSLNNKPRINNIELLGNKTLDELNIQQKGDFATKQELNTKQNNLVSGNNIKTINNQPILGNGNLNTKPLGGYRRNEYEQFGATFNESTNYYEYAGLTDITEEEMGIIVNSYIPYLGIGTFENCKARAFKFRTGVAYDKVPSCRICFRGANKLEMLWMGTESYGLYSKDLSAAFQDCSKLKEIKYFIDASAKPLVPGIFLRCYNLISVKIKKLATNINIKDSPNFNKESILFMIQNSAATSAITITLHPTAYTMAMADSEIQAALQEKTFVSLAQE